MERIIAVNQMVVVIGAILHMLSGRANAFTLLLCFALIGTMFLPFNLFWV